MESYHVFSKATSPFDVSTSGVRECVVNLILSDKKAGAFVSSFMYATYKVVDIKRLLENSKFILRLHSLFTKGRCFLHFYLILLLKNKEYTFYRVGLAY